MVGHATNVAKLTKSQVEKRLKLAEEQKGQVEEVYKDTLQRIKDEAKVARRNARSYKIEQAKTLRKEVQLLEKKKLKYKS